MKCEQIKCIRSDEHFDRWLLITDTGESFPYSKLFKDRSVEEWLARGHMVAHKVLDGGRVETWTFID